jgi:hypothetical protein
MDGNKLVVRKKSMFCLAMLLGSELKQPQRDGLTIAFHKTRDEGASKTVDKIFVDP